MQTKRWTILALAVGMLLAAGVPFPAAQADPGCGHGCPKGAGRAVPPCMQDNAAAAPGGMHRMMHGGGAPPMMGGMAHPMEEMRGAIAKLRALEAKMESLKSKDDAAAFRAASLEHSKLLTDLQEWHLKHMEGMMCGK
ncbi:MAG: hypothetical protein IH610_06380 [Deltaproteobacteria bacterium]|nr:hypothetical protein [Deltaproteobacteria bacterium]